MDEFTNFTQEIVTYSRYWKRHPVGRDINKGIIVFGHPNMVHLEVILRNILSMISCSWELVVITAKSLYTNTLQLCQFLDENIQVTVKDEFFKENYELNLNVYHSELSNIHFWINFPYEKFLIIHPDCMIIHPSITQYIEHYDLLNSYFSFLLPKNLEDIGNGGLVLRSINQIKSQIDTMKNHSAIPRIIDNFICEYSLNCLPEFYLYEKLINNNCLYLLSRSSIQLSSLWVHSPWKLGANWKDYLSRILTPKFNVINEPSLALFSESSPNYLGLVNMASPLKEYPKFPWLGLITGDSKLKSVTLQINPQQLVNCLGLYSNIKINSLNCPINCLVTVNKILNPKELIHQSDYAKQLVYSNLNDYLNKYQFVGEPFEQINNRYRSDKKEINIFDMRRETIPIDYDFRNKKTVLIVNDFQQLNETLHYEPLFYILPYRKNIRDKVKSTISISKYNYFGYYRHIPCLFMGPYANQTINNLHSIIVKCHAGKKSPFYLKQKEDQISIGSLPEKVFEVLLGGSNIITNNPQICDYFEGKILMVQDFLNKKRRYSNQTWTELMYLIKNNFALEHKAQIILSVVELLLNKNKPKSSKIQSQSDFTTSMESLGVPELSGSSTIIIDDLPEETRRKTSKGYLIGRPRPSISHNKRGLYAIISQTQAQRGRVVRRADPLTTRKMLTVTSNLRKAQNRTAMPINYNPSSVIHNNRDKVFSSLRFGGFNDKITSTMPMTSRKKSKISLAPYQTISVNRW